MATASLTFSTWFSEMKWSQMNVKAAIVWTCVFPLAHIRQHLSLCTTHHVPGLSATALIRIYEFVTATSHHHSSYIIAEKRDK